MNAQETRILMCSPEHFHVDYVINPWMEGNVDQASPDRARAQWRVLRDTLARFATIVEVPPAADLPDMVFTANAGTVCGTRAVLSRFFHPERQGEAAHFGRWFRDNGFEVLELPEGVHYEGAGDSLLDRDGEWIWAGYGFRTDLESHAHVARWLGREVVSLKLVDPYFYHLDTCMCPLSGGYLLYYPAAFDDASRREIERRVPAHKRIAVSDEDAERFACNTVYVGRRVVMNRASAPLRRRLEQSGFEVHEVDLSEFIKAGGSAKCLTLKVTEPEAVAPQPATG
jgi:N-dimethylarginine dimethylaminohydrolase